jgi:lysophospholipase L1-like esterase
MYWYEDEVKRLEKEHLKLAYQPETLFYGSSSIRLWISLYNDFLQLKPVNLGFGGSTLAACVWFFERIMQPYHPKKIIIYAGDNDLGDGRHPEEVLIFFQQLVVKTYQKFGDIPCYYISIKPSLSRWHMAEQFRYTNSLINHTIIKYHNNWQFIDVFKKMLTTTDHPKKEYFVDDGLHLSENGYKLWKEIINEGISAKP